MGLVSCDKSHESYLEDCTEVRSIIFNSESHGQLLPSSNLFKNKSSIIKLLIKIKKQITKNRVHMEMLLG
jgi:hypothetical protein